MISQEDIEKFLQGNDDEKYIVSVEYDYTTDAIYKVIEDPKGQGFHHGRIGLTPGILSWL